MDIFLCDLTMKDMEPDGGCLEDGWLAGVVPAVCGARILDDKVAARLLSVLCHHCDPAPSGQIWN